MSTDWSKYSSPEDTRARAAVPGENAVIALRAGDVRRIASLIVRHRPVQPGTVVDGRLIPPNRAHTDVVGDKTPEVRLRLLRACRLVLVLELPTDRGGSVGSPEDRHAL